MTEFISGLLVDSEDGAVYDEQVWDRFLTVQADNGWGLSVFDPSAITLDLAEGESYEYVMVATIFSALRAAGEPCLEGDADVWQATVVDANWQPPDADERFQRYSPNLLMSDRYLLVETSLGRLLMSPREVEQEVYEAAQVGMCLEWEDARLDLYAVV